MRNYVALLGSALMAVYGCSNGDGNAAREVGRNVGQTVTDFAGGVGQGIDTQLAVTVELAPAAAELGLSKSIAKEAHLGSSDGKTVSVYFLAQRAVNVTFTARALNAEGQEIGRRKVETEFADDDAKYVSFTFDPQMDSQLVDKYVIDVRERPAAEDAYDSSSAAGAAESP